MMSASSPQQGGLQGFIGGGDVTNDNGMPPSPSL